MDDDLEGLSREALAAEVVRLRAGIRRHRDSSGHELCWHHPELWGLLPEGTDPLPAVPDWAPFLHGCCALPRLPRRPVAARPARIHRVRARAT